MPDKIYNFFLPFSATVDEFDEFQSEIAFIKSDCLESTGTEILTSEILKLAVGRYADYIRRVNEAEEMQAEPAPYLDNIETL